MRIPTTLMCVGLIAGGCDRGRDQQPTADRTPSVEQVAEEPTGYYGKRVTLTGEVKNVLGPRAFRIEGDGVWLDMDEILVLTRSPASFMGAELRDDTDVIASGTLRRGMVVELERELGWDLDPEIEAEIQSKPVLVADSLRHIGEYSRWSADPMKNAAGLLAVLMITDAETLAGQRVHFENARVQGVSNTAVWVGPSKQYSVMVVPVNTAMLSGIEIGETVIVSGTVRDRTPQMEAEQPAAGGVSAQIYIDAVQLQAEPEPVPPPAS